MASLTRPVALDVESESAGSVIKMEDVVVGPVPAVVTAATTAWYWVPGCKPFTLIVDVLELAATDIPEFTGVTVTV